MVDMSSATEETPAERLEVAFDLFDFAIELIEARVLRERPGASPSDVDAAVNAWLSHRPGAGHGDAEGTPR